MDYVRFFVENRTSLLYFVRTTNIIPRPSLLIPQPSVTLHHETTFTYHHSSAPLVNHHRTRPVQHHHAASGTPQGSAPRHAAHKQTYTPYITYIPNLDNTPYKPYTTYRHLRTLQSLISQSPSKPRHHQPLRLPHRPLHPQTCLPQRHRPPCQLRTRLRHNLRRSHPCRLRQTFWQLCHHPSRFPHPQLLSPLSIPSRQRHPRPSQHPNRNYGQHRLAINGSPPPFDLKRQKKWKDT